MNECFMALTDNVNRMLLIEFDALSDIPSNQIRHHKSCYRTHTSTWDFKSLSSLSLAVKVKKKSILKKNLLIWIHVQTNWLYPTHYKIGHLAFYAKKHLKRSGTPLYSFAFQNTVYHERFEKEIKWGHVCVTFTKCIHH